MQRFFKQDGFRSLFGAVFFFALFLSSPLTHAQRGGERLKGVEEVEPIETREEAVAFLKNFRNQRLAGDYIFEFKLEHLPHRGESRQWFGRIWGTWTPLGPLTRVRIQPTRYEDEPLDFLVQSGAVTTIWKATPEGARLLEGQQLHQPLFPGLTYTPYDLALPFAYWQDFEYLETDRVKGFPAQVFRMLPPASVRERFPRLSSVDATFHADWHALMKAQMRDDSGEVFRVFQILDFAKVDEQYIVKTIDLRDEDTRDKTRFEVTAAAVGLTLEPELFFTPAALSNGEPPWVDISFRTFQ